MDHSEGGSSGDDPAKAAALFVQAIKGIEGVEAQPAPEALPWSLDASAVTLRVRWWTRSMRSDMVHLRARVILALWQAAREHGIDLPYPTTQVLMHDQTEPSDGDRARQREGWPAEDKASQTDLG